MSLQSQVLFFMIIKEIEHGTAANESQEEEGKSFEVVIFNHYNRLCSIFPSIRLPFSGKISYEVRLSFCLPEIEPPSMAPTINEELIEDISVRSVENRAEAPWIRRNMGGVIFTENFLEREEKEIENLNEVIRANGLIGIKFRFF